MKLSDKIKNDLKNLLELKSDNFIYIDDYLTEIEKLEKEKEELIQVVTNFGKKYCQKSDCGQTFQLSCFGRCFAGQQIYKLEEILDLSWGQITKEQE